MFIYFSYKKIPNRTNSIKNKKAKISLVNEKDNQCFQYALTVTLNHVETKTNSQKLIKVKNFLKKYDWEGVNFPSDKCDWKKFGKNNITFTFNICVS